MKKGWFKYTSNYTLRNNSNNNKKLTLSRPKEGWMDPVVPINYKIKRRGLRRRFNTSVRVHYVGVIVTRAFPSGKLLK